MGLSNDDRQFRKMNHGCSCCRSAAIEGPNGQMPPHSGNYYCGQFRRFVDSEEGKNCSSWVSDQ